MKKMFSVLAVSLMTAALLSACGTADKPAESPSASAPEASAPATPASVHPDYDKYKKDIDTAKASIAKYEDVNVALKDGFIPGSGFVPLMGYHFINPAVTEFKLDKPNTLMYVIENGKYKLVGAEWGTPDKAAKSPFGEAAPFKLVHVASAHYADGTELDAKSEKESFPTHPKTGSKMVAWHPDIYGAHAWVTVQNPDGAFTDSNPALAKYSDNPSTAPLDEAHGLSKEYADKFAPAAPAGGSHENHK